ncbi:MAG: hypothetical protein KBS66_07910 [Eubacterium sp.]|nr:hypothetical protein [Candidatus Colimonas fimequi]
MNQFDKILNSSDASDALLGEQIDAATGRLEIVEAKVNRNLTYSKTLTSGGDSYNLLGTVGVKTGDIIFFKPMWSIGQPVGIRFVRRSNGAVLKTYESTTYDENMLLYIMMTEDMEIDVEVKTNKTNPTIRGYIKVIR